MLKRILSLSMLAKTTTLLMLTSMLIFCTSANQTDYNQIIEIEENELWYGAAVNEGEKMPFEKGYKANLNGKAYGNQASPLLISNKGRYIWSEAPFAFEFREKHIVISENSEPIHLEKNGNTLKEGYLGASGKYFPPKNKLPEMLLFTSPQYNTWIELIRSEEHTSELQSRPQLVCRL